MIEHLKSATTSALATFDYPGAYRRGQVFDEVIANVYALMISRVVHYNDYRFPEFLHPDVTQAFEAVIPWPPGAQ